MPSASRQRREYDAATKAAAMAALLEGQSVSAVARQYQLPKGTVSNWKRHGAGVQADRTQKAEGGKSIGDLLITLLQANIEGLIAASSVMKDDAWVRRQGATELGTFLGITHDKVVRMLEAMDASHDPSSPVS